MRTTIALASLTLAASASLAADCIIGTAPYSKDDHGRITLPETAVLRMLPQYNGVREDGTRFTIDKATLVLQDEQRGFWPLVARLTDAETSSLLAQLDKAIETRDAAGDWGAGTDASVYTAAYETRESGTLVLPADLELRVLPMYRGQGADGSPIVDKRVTLVVNDPAQRFWSTIVWLDAPAAKDLRMQLVRTMAQRLD